VQLGWFEGERVLQRTDAAALTFIRNFESLNNFSLLIGRPRKSPLFDNQLQRAVDSPNRGAMADSERDSEHWIFDAFRDVEFSCVKIC
jgi:hypothetical protein